MSFSRSSLRRLFWGLSLSGLAALILERPATQPSFHDRPLTFWLRQYHRQPDRRDPETSAALLALGKFATPEIRRRLVAPDRPARRLLGTALRSAFGIGGLTPGFATGDDLRASAAEASMHLPEAERTHLLPALVQGLRLAQQDGTDQAIRRSILALGIDPTSRLIPLVLDQDLAVRVKTTDFLGSWIRARGALPSDSRNLALALAFQLPSPSTNLTRSVTELLALLGGKAEVAIPGLVQGLRHPDPTLRATTAMTLGSVLRQPQVCIPALANLLTDPVEPVRCSAATALGFFGEAAANAVPALVEAAGSQRTSLAVAAANALGRIGPKAADAGAVLVSNLDRTEPVVRASSAAALGRIGVAYPASAGRLASALDDPDEYVRRNSARALRALGQHARPALSELIAALRDPAESVRVDAVEALGSMGPAARSAIPFLEAARNNNQSVMNPPVLIALARIGGGMISAEGLPGE